MPEYRSVKLPNELIEEIKRIIAEHKELGYMSHSEFIKDATRRRLEVINEKLSNVVPSKINEKVIGLILQIYRKYKESGELQLADFATVLNISPDKLLDYVVKLTGETQISKIIE